MKRSSESYHLTEKGCSVKAYAIASGGKYHGPGGVTSSGRVQGKKMTVSLPR